MWVGDGDWWKIVWMDCDGWEEAKWAWQSERRRNGGIQEWSGVW